MRYSHCSTIFNQLLSFLPKDRFNRFVDLHKGDKYVKRFTTWNQLVVLIYAQATGKESLREIETGLKSHEGLWYHLGIESAARSSIADANNRRSSQIFEKLFYALFEECKSIIPERTFDFKNPLYSFDSTTINLCLSVFDWAKYRTTKGALKMHLLLNNRTAIPELITITEGKVSDVTEFKKINLDKLEKGSIIVFDRGYIDYGWWRKIDDNELFFVSRKKANQNIHVIGQHKNAKMDEGVISDEIIMFADYNVLKKKIYPKDLRMIKYWDKEKEKEYVYITNNFELTAKQVAGIYRDRWQIELFFKWIKQNLKIKTFLGTSRNAVMTQIWIAMIYYLLLAYIKFQTKFKRSLLEFTRMIRETLLFRRNIIDLLSLEVSTLVRIKPKESPQLAFW